MRAALGILRLPCALLAGIALASAGPAIPVIPASSQASRTPPILSDPASGAAAPQAPRPQDLLFACPTTRDHVGRVVASVTIDGKGPFRFIIDTGANQSTISPKLASVLGLAPSASDRIRIAGVTGTEIVPSVPIDSLRAGALVIEHSHFPVIWSPIMTGADGILGAAGLAEDSLLVDFRRNSVVIHSSDAAAIPLGFSTVHATRLRGGLLSVPGGVGGVAVDAVIDTGSPQTLGNIALYRALYSRSKVARKTTVYGVTKQVRRGDARMAPSIDLGAILVGNAVLVYGDFPIFKVWGLTERPAIIVGMDVIGTVDAFAIDFRHAEIGFDPRFLAPDQIIPLND